MRYEQQSPGNLMYIQTKNPDRFRRLGHSITIKRQSADLLEQNTTFHVAIYDAKRLA